MLTHRRTYLKSRNGSNGYGVEILYNDEQLKEFAEEHNLKYFDDDTTKNSYKLILSHGREYDFNEGLNLLYNFPLLIHYTYSINEIGWKHYTMFLMYNIRANKELVDLVFTEDEKMDAVRSYNIQIAEKNKQKELESNLYCNNEDQSSCIGYLTLVDELREEIGKLRRELNLLKNPPRYGGFFC